MPIFNMAKVMIVVGILLVLSGLFLILVTKLPFLGRLPGDIYIKKGNFTFYFPIVTSIILSIILTILINLFFRK